MGWIVALLLLWLLLIAAGLIVKALIWLAAVGVILFLATAAAGALWSDMSDRNG